MDDEQTAQESAEQTADTSTREPWEDLSGAALAAWLEGVFVADLSDRELLAAVRGVQRLTGWAAAVQVDAAAELRARRVGPAEQAAQQAGVAGDAGEVRLAERRAEMAERGLVAELGAELSCSALLAGRLVHAATVLPTELPATLQAMRTGAVEPRKVQVLCGGLLEITDPRVRGQVEAELLGVARSLNVPNLQEALAKAILRAQPITASEASRQARAGRRVVFRAMPDDMMEMWARLPADAGVRLKHGLTLAAELAKTPADERSLDQRRADCLVDSVVVTVESPLAETPTDAPTEDVAGATPTRGRRPGRRRRRRGGRGVGQEIVVNVPLETVTGEAAEPGHLSGYGPITADLARQMAWEVAAEGSWRCAVTDPVHGTLLGLGRSTFTPNYRAPADLFRHVATRDQRCRFPGCRARAARCDVDHRRPWPEGATCECKQVPS